MTMNDSRVFVDTNIYWDCLILASALEHNCGILYTEDLQNGQIIEKSLKIVNPFVSSLLSQR